MVCTSNFLYRCLIRMLKMHASFNSEIIIKANWPFSFQLCYDYKFDFEDDQHKIACHCGAVNCRKWMN